jgi:hypothetical protein
MSDILNIPLFDDDFYKMVLRFALNMFFLTLIIRWLYYSVAKRMDYLFTYYMIGIVVFFLCFTLKKYELDLGMALGLFAIFGIIRYRTNPIPIKEMTYLFVVIGISVVNSLANQKMSIAEILGANTLVLIALYLMEKVWKVPTMITKTINYENIDNIKPEKEHLLRADLEERTGLKIQEIEVGDIDFLKDSTTVIIKYFRHEN